MWSVVSLPAQDRDDRSTRTSQRCEKARLIPSQLCHSEDVLKRADEDRSILKGI